MHLRANLTVAKSDIQIPRENRVKKIIGLLAKKVFRISSSEKSKETAATDETQAQSDVKSTENIKPKQSWLMLMLLSLKRKIVFLITNLRYLFSYDVDDKDRISMHLLWVVTISFGAFVAWALIAEIDRVVTANAKAYPYAKLQTVEHYEGGRVEKILVKQGDIVRRGDLLITLSPIQTLGELTIQTDLLAELTVKQARLLAEYENQDSFVVSDDIESLHPTIVQQERAYFRERRRQRLGELQSKKAEYESVKAQLAAVKVGMRASEQEFETMKKLLKRGLEPELSLIKSEKEFADAKSALESTRQELLKAENELDRIVREQQTEVLKELSDVRGQLTSARENIRVAADKADRSELRAPSDGVVNNVLVSTVGGTVKPGEPVVEIVPEGSQIVVEALIKPADIGFIEIGQEALVKITAYDFSVFGSLKGEVAIIAADTTTEESGEQFYKVTIALLQKFLDSKGRRLEIIPGMEAQVDVVVGKRTAMDYILSPLLRVTQESLREK